MQHDPEVLPLLSDALQATWKHCEDRTLTVAGYRAAGGIRGAVATTAEAIFQGFDPAMQQAARRLLLRMVQIGDGVSDARLRADRNTLIAHSPDPTAASAVLDAFACARSITTDEEAAEITHEALLHAWPRLRSWIDADRAGLYVHQQLTEAAQRRDRDGRPASALYRDTVLRWPRTGPKSATTTEISERWNEISWPPVRSYAPAGNRGSSLRSPSATARHQPHLPACFQPH
jgi:hypothetical protein